MVLLDELSRQHDEAQQQNPSGSGGQVNGLRQHRGGGRDETIIYENTHNG